MLRGLALDKLDREGSNAHAGSALATLTPREHRVAAVEAIVAYQVMFDYLDGLTESPTADPLGSGRELCHALIDSLSLDAQHPARYQDANYGDDGGYLRDLVDAVHSATRRLPSAGAITQAATAAARRSVEAQLRFHAAPSLATLQLMRWAEAQTEDGALSWREYLAGAMSSVITVHALIAAAGDVRTSTEDARALDTTYLSVSALSTMLDSVIDRQRDLQTSQPSFIDLYDSHQSLVEELSRTASRGVMLARGLPNGPHHVAILVAVAAYFISTPEADSDFAQPATRAVRAQLEPLITPAIATMRAWRAAKSARAAIAKQPPRQ